MRYPTVREARVHRIVAGVKMFASWMAVSAAFWYGLYLIAQAMP